MLDQLKHIAIFAEVVVQGSFRAAAKSLSLSPSAISYHISELENRLGTALIYRTTRQLSLTSEGKTLFRYAKDMAMAAEQGIHSVSSRNEALQGELSLSITTALVHSPLNAQLAEFSKRQPGVALTISYSDEQKDLVGGRIDLAFRAGVLADSSLKAKRMGCIERSLVCTPSYYATRTIPQHPKDVSSWHWVELSMMPGYREVTQGNITQKLVIRQRQLSVDSVIAMTQMVRCDLGLATPPTSIVADDLATGKLVQVLPEWSVKPIPYYALWPDSGVTNATTAALLAFLTCEDTES